MINYVMIGTNRFEEAVQFYEALMAEMGAERVYVTERKAGWGWGVGTVMFIVTKPYDQQRASIGNGSMVAFDVASPELVDKLHAKALALGGTTEGDPGVSDFLCVRHTMTDEESVCQIREGRRPLRPVRPLS